MEIVLRIRLFDVEDVVVLTDALAESLHDLVDRGVVDDANDEGWSYEDELGNRLLEGDVH